MSPSLDAYSTYPGNYEYKYPMAGVKNSKVSVHTFDIKSKVTRKMDLPIDEESYIPRIKFTNNPEALAVMVLNHHQNQFDLYYSNPRSTVSKIMIRDNNPQYIKEDAYSNIAFYPENIVIMSERDGYNHLYLYSHGGNLIRQITKGKFEVKNFLGWDRTTNTFFYESNEGNPTQTAIYKIDSKGKKTKLSTGVGTNSAIFSKNMKYYINTFSNISTPTVVTVNDNNGKVIATMLDNSKLKSKLAQMVLPSKELFKFTTSQGIELNGWIIKPADFDKNKKYPVIMYQYSGPGSQEVKDRWDIGSRRDGGMFEAYLAQNGYISVCVDGRGTGGRGSDFEKCTYLNIGIKEASDQVETAKHLASLPYIDGSRIGIWGWSYGGYNTLMSMSEGSSAFKAGVAVAAPTDWRFYDSVYTERFMRTPKENMEGYNSSSAINRASKLSGKLLLIHGTADDNVHLRNNAEYAEALVQADKQFDMQIYTNRNHGIRGGNTSKHLFTKIVSFFNQNLK
jgi:Dipeptidyl aminopeptidases/acylaminoacyl-peptidases